MAFKFPFKKNTPTLKNTQTNSDSDSDSKFLSATHLFIKKRKEDGISLEDLSQKTKISRNVLIAIENGWVKYLPEKTYLISMIKKLEGQLNLEKGSLNGLLIKKMKTKNNSVFKLRFINIDFLNSRIGSLIYIIVMFLSILALNSQQKYLLKINSQSTEPISIENNIIVD